MWGCSVCVLLLSSCQITLLQLYTLSYFTHNVISFYIYCMHCLILLALSYHSTSIAYIIFYLIYTDCHTSLKLSYHSSSISYIVFHLHYVYCLIFANTVISLIIRFLHCLTLLTPSPRFSINVLHSDIFLIFRYERVWKQGDEIQPLSRRNRL